MITGRIGAGKTTLLEVLLGLLPRSSWSHPPRLFSDSFKNNILLGLPEQAVNLQDAIHLSVMEPDIKRLDDGLDTLIGPRGTKLSGGQIQRTAAARMYVRSPFLGSQCAP